MLDLLAVAWLVLSIVVLASTRANRYLVLGTLGTTLLAAYCAAGVWMNGALSVAMDDRSAQQHVRAATMFEVLTVVAMAAATGCLVVAWRRRPRRGALHPAQNVARSGTL